MSIEIPSIRAGFVQSTAEAIAGLDAELHAAVLSGMSMGHQHFLRDASRVSWIPVEVDVDLTERLFEQAGVLGARKVFRQTTLESFQGPLMNPLLRAARRLFGSSVQRTLSWSAKPWSLIYKNCGELTPGALGAKSGRLVLTGLPLSICRSPVYLQGTCGAIEGFYQAAGVSGSVHLSGPDPGRREATFLLRWDQDVAEMAQPDSDVA